MRHVMRALATAALTAGLLLPLPAGAAAAASPTPSSTPSPAAAAVTTPTSTPTPTPTPTPTGTPVAGVSAAWHSSYCGADYGWFVTNGSDVPHTLTLTLNGDPSTITVQPGQTYHVGNADRGDGIRLVDDNGDVLIDSVGYDCIARYTADITVQSGSSWTRSLIGGGPMAPAAGHGTVAFEQTGRLVRYTPDACFTGTDAFGFKDVIVPEEVVVHVTVAGPAVGCPTTAPALGGGQVTLPHTGVPVGPAAWTGALALLLGAVLLLVGRQTGAGTRVASRPPMCTPSTDPSAPRAK